MKPSDLLALVSGRDIAKLKASIHGPIQVWRDRGRVKGAPPPIEITLEEIDTHITNCDVQTICLAFVDNEIDAIELEYLMSFLDTCSNFSFESEQSRKYVSSFSDSVTTPYTLSDVKDAVLILSL
ncbi:hypothetical protein JYT83_00425 [bacterium AH-315-F18]|nr:hypothetical protein [bacterium AH-315-F18]